MLLAADVGGTKTTLGLFRVVGRRVRSVREATFPSQESRSFEAMIRAFLARGRERVRACAVGVAGPVVGGRSGIVNLRWSVDASRVGRLLGVDHVSLINDLEATAWGVGELMPSQMVSLTPRIRPRPGNGAVIAAGTGLGMALLFWDGARFQPSASEGGHQGFAPRGDEQADLLRHLAERLGRVSAERVVSGPGISAIYRFLVETRRGTESESMKRRLAAGDPNAAIADAGLNGEDALAERAMDLFVSIYGAVAGDLALAAKAVAGVYVAGGIAPRILSRLRGGDFIEAFRDKGRLTPLVERIPVRVVLEPRTPLLGAAACAARFQTRPRR